MKMKCPEGGTGCSIEGVDYTADETGVVDVPAEAAGGLINHGFTVVQGTEQDVSDADADAKAAEEAAAQEASDRIRADNAEAAVKMESATYVKKGGKK